MSAARLLTEAAAAGISVRLEGGTVRLSAAAAPPAELLARLRDHRGELLDLLRRDTCRSCQAPVDWLVPGGITFADGSAAHLACYEAEAAPCIRAAAADIGADRASLAASIEECCAPASRSVDQPLALGQGHVATSVDARPCPPSVTLGSMSPARSGGGPALLSPPSKRYAVILADPPWSFATYSRKGEGRSAEAHYNCMALEQIKALPVADWAADDAVLLLWATDPLLPRALEVISAWGFTYKTVGFYWMKSNASGNGFFTGMGYWTRANPEQCLLATRGQPKRRAADVKRLIVSPRREHSRKPDEVYERIERLVDGPYLELFARASRPGWDGWGAQASLFDQGPVKTRRWASDSYPEAAK